MKYRVFSNDIGLNAYSALATLSAPSLGEAKLDAKRRWSTLPSFHKLKILVLPEDRKDLWPDSITGKIRRAAEVYIVGHK